MRLCTRQRGWSGQSNLVVAHSLQLLLLPVTQLPVSSFTRSVFSRFCSLAIGVVTAGRHRRLVLGSSCLQVFWRWVSCAITPVLYSLVASIVVTDYAPTSTVSRRGGCESSGDPSLSLPLPLPPSVTLSCLCGSDLSSSSSYCDGRRDNCSLSIWPQ